MAAEDLSTLQPQGYVSDFANVLNSGTRQQLNDYCDRLKQVTGSELAVVTVKTLNDQPIEDAANALFRRWGIGKKGEDNGLLLLIAVQDHKDRLEVGYGLEPILPDGFDGSILRGLRPYLSQNQYDAGVLNAVQQIGARIAAAKGVSIDGLAPQAPRPRRVRHESGIPWPLVVIGVIILINLFSRGRGGGGGFLTGMILGNVLGRSGRWGGGGFGGYDSGSGGGGGGFGGFGGGDSGGGGASSNW